MSLLKFNPSAAEFVPTFGSFNTCPIVPENHGEKEITSDTSNTVSTSSSSIQEVQPVSENRVSELDDFQVKISSFEQGSPSLVARIDGPMSESKNVENINNIQTGDLNDRCVISDPPSDDDKAKDLSSPLRLWAGDEPPKLVWSRSVDEAEMRRFAADCAMDEHDELAEMHVQDSNLAPDAVVDDSHSSNHTENVAVKSKVTVDDFEILCMVGEGGFGKVFQVRKKDNLTIFAMKCMRKDCVIKDNLQGTRNERHILSSVRHPFIVNMHYAFQCKGRLYLVMDYFPGGQFLDLLHHHAPFAPEAYTLYTGEIALALKELHARGIVHRDLKPENLLVDAEGHLVMTDFGCSKLGNESGSVRTDSWAGTELYMAPEQLQRAEYGAEVDWWALGALAWEMCTGDNPFFHSNRKVMYNNILRKKLTLPSWLAAPAHSFLKGLLCRDPTRRLGHGGGAAEVQAHPFFRALDFEALLARRLPAPLRSHAKTADVLDTSAHAPRYTRALAALSPLPSPGNLLPTPKQALFVDFDYFPDSLCLPAPAQPTPAASAPPRVLSSPTAAPTHAARPPTTMTPRAGGPEDVSGGGGELGAVARTQAAAVEGGVAAARSECKVSAPAPGAGTPAAAGPDAPAPPSRGVSASAATAQNSSTGAPSPLAPSPTVRSAASPVAGPARAPSASGGSARGGGGVSPRVWPQRLSGAASGAMANGVAAAAAMAVVGGVAAASPRWLCCLASVGSAGPPNFSLASSPTSDAAAAAAAAAARACSPASPSAAGGGFLFPMPAMGAAR